MAVKHAFTSTIPDEGIAGKVAPSHWNADHTIEDATVGVSQLTVAAQAYLVPSGGIIMWSGSIATIPTGWLLCNGTNGTPDLRDKFVVGAYADDAGVAKSRVTNGSTFTQSGGAATHTHTEHNAHVHLSPVISGTTSAGSSHTHTISEQSTQNTKDQGTGTSFNFVQAHSHGGTTGAEEAHTHTAGSLAVTTPMNATGTGVTTHVASQSLPPYFALAYIMKS